MDGMLLTYGDMIMKSSDMVEMVFEDREIKWILGAGVNKIEGLLITKT
jgi:sulfide:quinone oxidoreductase